MVRGTLRLLIFPLALTVHENVASAQDFDSDGLQDAVDVLPCDATAVAEAFAPALGGHGTTTFEDQWPGASDLDFNDVVIAHNVVAKLDQNGKVSGVRFSFSVLALGGTLDNGLGWHLPIPANRVRAIRRTSGLETVALERSASDDELTFVIFDNLRELFNGRAGTINSDPDEAGAQPQSAVVEIDLSPSVDLALGPNPFDLFIFRSADRSHEIHLPQYPGTSAMDQTLFRTGQDASTDTRRFVDRDGLPYAISLPLAATYPREKVAISSLYPDIVEFAATNGRQRADFYENVVTDAGFTPKPTPAFLQGSSYDDGSCGVPLCYDGIRSGDEDGIDCGGEFCESCPGALTAISPENKTLPLTTPLILTVLGESFPASAKVTWSGTQVPATFVSSTKLVATIPALAVPNAGTYQVRVVSGSETSPPLTFTALNPVPATIVLDPASIAAGGVAALVRITGGPFAPDAKALADGAELETVWTSWSEIVATVPASLLANGDEIDLSVKNPAPGGGESPLVTFTVNNAMPVISALSVTSATMGDPAITLTVTGTGFARRATVNLAGVATTTQYVSSTRLIAVIPEARLAIPGDFQITVTNPIPGGGTSAPVTFNVRNPVPAVEAILPSGAIAGDPTLTITLRGRGFVSGAVVRLGGASLMTTFGSQTELTAVVPASALTTSGERPITVVNPAPGGGESGPLPFTVSNPVPAISSATPSSANVSDAPFVLTLRGSGFNSATQVTFDGVAAMVTVVSASEIRVSVSAAMVPAGGSKLVRVTNPEPGGGSAETTIAIANSAAVLTAISPSTASTGSGAVTLTLSGTGFLNGATVRFGGIERPGTFISSTAIAFGVTASELAVAGPKNVSVQNPLAIPSNAITFSVLNPMPVISALAPLSSPINTSVTLTLTGTAFVRNATVAVDGIAISTTFVSPTQLVATLPAARIPVAGNYAVTVVQPAPGGGTSNALTFTAQNVAPTATAISPSALTAGGGNVTLTITGSGFVSGARVNAGGAFRTTTFVSSTVLLAQLPADAYPTGRTIAVYVENPGPGGGNSASLSLTVNNLVPTIGDFTPSTGTCCANDIVVTVTGTNFNASTTATLNGTTIPVTYENATHVSLRIPAALNTAGAKTLVLTNPAPGGGTVTRSFSIDNASPTFTGLSPSTVAAGASATLILDGVNLAIGATVEVGGQIYPATFVSSSRVVAAIPAFAAGGTYPVVVVNPTPGGGRSNAIDLNVTNPVPTVASISTTSGLRNVPVTLTITGTNFNPSSRVSFNGTSLVPSSQTSTQLVVAISADRITNAGTYSVSVVNPAPGGGTSTSATFTAQNAAPTIAALSPSTGTCCAAFTLTVDGTNFVASTTATYAGTAATVTYVSPTRILLAVTAALNATAGSKAIAITNPSPGGGTANTTLTVQNEVPTLTSLSPAFATVGGAAPVVTINGTGFVSGAVASWDGTTAATTTYVSPTQLTVTVSAGDLATPRTRTLSVRNPSSAADSNALTFEHRTPVPTLTSISPTSGTVGVPVTVTLTGTNFVSGASSVTLDGAALPTTYVSATRLVVELPAAGIASAGAHVLAVINASPGGGTTVAQTYTTSYSNATLTSISPTSVAVGSAAFSLTLNGTNFGAATQATLNGANLTTTFVSATRIVALVPAPLLASADLAPVTVVNPSPSNTVSAAQILSITPPTPAVASVSPSTAPGGSTVDVTIEGTNFVSGSEAFLDGQVMPTSYVSATRVVARVSVRPGVAAGVHAITVQNPLPSTAVVGPIDFTVTVNCASLGWPFGIAADGPNSYTYCGLGFEDEITSGNNFSCGLTLEGGIKCWGQNDFGQLGDGTTTNRTTPVSVPIEGVHSVSAGREHACALKDDGTVWCWGRGAEGELGNGGTANSGVPVQVTGITSAIEVTAGRYHTCAILTDSSARCWGLNSSYQLGDTTTTNRSSPVSARVVAITSIAPGLNHTCVSAANGNVYCWGVNSSGEIGDGTTSTRTTPVEVTGIENAVRVYSFAQHNCVLLSDQTVRCWGRGTEGQLGNGGTSNRTTPVTATGLSDVVRISTSETHSCAARNTDGAGTLYCWGSNTNGKLGNGTTTNRTTPVTVANVSNGWRVSAGVGHTCALSFDGLLRCWGLNASGQLADGTTTNRTTAVSSVGFRQPDVHLVATSPTHTCGVRSDGTVRCWGSNGSGQLGNGTTTQRSTPVAVTGVENAVAVAVGTTHSCALLRSGRVWCWGANSSGQLGDGTTTNRSTAAAVINVSTAAAIAASGSQTCVRLANGTVSCWGANTNGQLGDGTTTQRPSPVSTRGLSYRSSANSIATGAGGHTCAGLEDGTIRCWGANTVGQLGDGTTFNRTIPVEVSGITTQRGLASFLSQSSCTVLLDGTTRCWGSNVSGGFGNGTTTSVSTAVAAFTGITTAASMTIGSHGCVRLLDGTARCAGRNDTGMLGDGTTTQRLTPVTVSGLTDAADISGGEVSHTCARLQTGAMRCWGNNSSNQLGDGTTTTRTTPVTLSAF